MCMHISTQDRTVVSGSKNGVWHALEIHVEAMVLHRHMGTKR